MTAEPTDRDYDRLRRLLEAVSLRHQLLALFEFFTFLASGVLLLLLGSLTLLNLSGILPYFPLAYCLCSIVFLACLVWRGLRGIRQRPSLQETARGLEGRFPLLRDDVTNSILLSGRAGTHPSADRYSSSLIRAQLKKTAEKASIIKPSDVVSFRKGLRRLAFLLPLALTLAVVLVIDSAMVGRALALLSHPFSTVPTMHSIITLDRENPTVVARGTPVALGFAATGKAPERLTLLTWPEGGDPGRFVLTPKENGRFVHLTGPAVASFRYRAANDRGDVSPVGLVRVVDRPDIEKLRLTLTPPPYTGLPAHTQEVGRIAALCGTLVDMDVTTTKEVMEGEMVLDGQNRYPLNVDSPVLTPGVPNLPRIHGRAQRPLEGEAPQAGAPASAGRGEGATRASLTAGRRLSGSLLVLHAGQYSIKVKDSLGLANPDPVMYEIRVLPDRFPEAEMSHPSADMEIRGDEVIPVTYIVRDDFGITSVRLVYQIRGEERQISLKSPLGRRSLGPETFKWDLSGLALLPGERVTFRIEAEDNDAISGPKKGFSRSIVLSVRDERNRASQEEADRQRLAESLLGLLADQLEEKQNPETLEKRLDEILGQVGKNLDRVGDRPERFDLEALQRNLASLKERASQEPSEKVTQELERSALLAEDIARSSRLNEVEAMTREIRNRQRQLIDVFREFKGPPTREALEKMTAQLKKLEELLRSVMDALGKLATRLPDEFINSQELSGLEFQDMFGELAEMYRKLAEGDMAGALEAAQRMLQNLQEMMAALGRAGTRAGASPSDRLQDEMSRQASELENILASQREVYADTGQIGSAVAQAADEETTRRLDSTLPLLRGALDRLRRSLPAEQADMVDSAEKLLDGRQLEGVKSFLEESERALQGSGEAEAALRELTQLMKRLRAVTSDVLDKVDRTQFPGLSERQGAVKERTESFLERLEALAQLFPGMDTNMLKDIEKAADSMGVAAGRLKGEDAEGALPPEEEAIRRLSKSQQAMQQMGQQMAQQAGSRMQANRWGYALAYDPRPGWYYGPWMPMPTLPQPEVKFPREKGQTGIDREEFEPPSKDAYKVPQRFREKIMESMKERVPEEYRKDVDRYLRGLAE